MLVGWSAREFPKSHWCDGGEGHDDLIERVARATPVDGMKSLTVTIDSTYLVTPGFDAHSQSEWKVEKAGVGPVSPGMFTIIWNSQGGVPANFQNRIGPTTTKALGHVIRRCFALS